MKKRFHRKVRPLIDIPFLRDREVLALFHIKAKAFIKIVHRLPSFSFFFLLDAFLLRIDSLSPKRFLTRNGRQLINVHWYARRVVNQCQQIRNFAHHHTLFFRGLRKPESLLRPPQNKVHLLYRVKHVHVLIERVGILLVRILYVGDFLDGNRQTTLHSQFACLKHHLHAMPEMFASFWRIIIGQETYLARAFLDQCKVVLIPGRTQRSHRVQHPDALQAHAIGCTFNEEHLICLGSLSPSVLHAKQHSWLMKQNRICAILILGLLVTQASSGEAYHMPISVMDRYHHAVLVLVIAAFVHQAQLTQKLSLDIQARKSFTRLRGIANAFERAVLLAPTSKSIALRFFR